METRDGFDIGTPGVADEVGKRIAASGKRRGRPPGSKTRAKASPVNATVPGDSVDSARKDCAPFVEMAMLVFVSGDEFLKRSIIIKVRQYVGANEPRLKEFETEVFARYAVTDSDKTYLRSILLALAIKYPLLRKIGPEVSLAVFLVRYGAQHLQLLRAVEKLKPKAEPIRPHTAEPSTS